MNAKGRPDDCGVNREVPPEDRSISALSDADLRRLASAAAEVSECARVLDKTGSNVVGELLAGADGFIQWNHYPDGDAYDPQTHSQYYYHAHPQGGARPFVEHGHFHLFLRKPGMPRGVGPTPGQSPVAGEGVEVSHLFAISMNVYGVAKRLFTTNRWVTGDTWYDAADVIAMLDRFDVDVARPNWLVNRWVTAMARLFRPQIAALLRERDAQLEAWMAAHRGTDPFEDRRLEIISSCEIEIGRQIAAVTAARGMPARRRVRPDGAPKPLHR